MLTSIQFDQKKTEDLVVKWGMQLNTQIAGISKDAAVQNINLNRTIKSIGSSGFPEVKDVKDILLAYIEEDKEDKKANRIKTEITTAETDIELYQLLNESFTMYQAENFTAAIKTYKNVLDIYPSNSEALCYFNASLYYQNPGDIDNFFTIKRDLVPLLERENLSVDEERTALNVLKSIAMEGGDSALQIEYQNALTQLKGEQ